MISLVHANHSIDLDPDTMVIVEKATEEMYHRLANEDLKIEFDGERLYIHSPARIEHEKAVENFLIAFREYFRDHPEHIAVGSRHGLRLPNGKRPEPDVMILPRESIDPKSAIFEGTPLLVIEILSPSNREHDLTTKRDWYKDAKVPEIWYIDLSNNTTEILVYDDKEGYNAKKLQRDKFSSEILADFSITMDEIRQLV